MGKSLINYSLFSTQRRGGEDVGFEIKSQVEKMQTAENLIKLAQAISLDCWGQNQTKCPKMDFSQFEEKLNTVKQEYFSKMPKKE